MIRRAILTTALASIISACGKSDDTTVTSTEILPTPSNGKINAKLSEMGIELPEAKMALATYTPWRKIGNMVYIAGQAASDKGVIGKKYNTQQGYAIAREAAILVLSQLKAACDGDLDRVEQCVQLQGIVRCTNDFTEQHLVINGASELFQDVFGDSGLAARAAVGTNSLPIGDACEVIATFEIT